LFFYASLSGNVFFTLFFVSSTLSNQDLNELELLLILQLQDKIVSTIQKSILFKSESTHSNIVSAENSLNFNNISSVIPHFAISSLNGDFFT